MQFIKNKISKKYKLLLTSSILVLNGNGCRLFNTHTQLQPDQGTRKAETAVDSNSKHKKVNQTSNTTKEGHKILDLKDSSEEIEKVLSKYNISSKKNLEDTLHKLESMLRSIQNYFQKLDSALFKENVPSNKHLEGPLNKLKDALNALIDCSKKVKETLFKEKVLSKKDLESLLNELKDPLDKLIDYSKKAKEALCKENVPPNTYLKSPLEKLKYGLNTLINCSKQVKKTLFNKEKVLSNKDLETFLKELKNCMENMQKALSKKDNSGYSSGSESGNESGYESGSQEDTSKKQVTSIDQDINHPTTHRPENTEQVYSNDTKAADDQAHRNDSNSNHHIYEALEDGGQQSDDTSNQDAHIYATIEDGYKHDKPTNDHQDQTNADASIDSNMYDSVYEPIYGGDAYDASSHTSNIYQPTHEDIVHDHIPDIEKLKLMDQLYKIEEKISAIRVPRQSDPNFLKNKNKKKLLEKVDKRLGSLADLRSKKNKLYEDISKEIAEKDNALESKDLKKWLKDANEINKDIKKIAKKVNELTNAIKKELPDYNTDVINGQTRFNANGEPYTYL